MQLSVTLAAVGLFPGYMALQAVLRRLRRLRGMQFPQFPSLGGAASPGVSTSTSVNPMIQIVALAMIGAAFLGAIVVMVVSYIHDASATLPTAISAILFFGLGFITHALGNAQGTANTQTTVASTTTALTAATAQTAAQAAAATAHATAAQGTSHEENAI